MATAVVAFGDSLLAFGGINGGCCDGSFSTDTRAVVWSSTDGRSWRLHRAGPEFALGGIAAAAASAERVVAIGERVLPPQTDDGEINRQGAVWTSADGEAWELVADVPIFSTVVATPTGFVAASNMHAFSELWWSETGSTWEQIAGLEELGTGRIDRLLATPIGFVGAGSRVNPEAAGQSVAGAAAAVWRSSDGEVWAQVPYDATFAGASMRDAAWSDGRLLAVSDGSSDRLAFWTSTDGERWDRIDAPGVADAETWPAHVVGLSQGFAVAGTWSSEADESQHGMVVWTTQDGLDWQRSTQPGQVEINDWVLMPAGGVAVVGWGWSSDVERAVPLAWTIATPG